MEILGDRIHYPSNEHTTPGYLARPETDGIYPALVVIQEWWGLVPHIEDVARRFAGEGYLALAPDLYHGVRTTEPDEARKMAMTLDRTRAVAEISAAVRYLLGMEAVQPKTIGVVGWCMGGGLALSAAADDGGIGAVVVFYGRPLSVEDTARLHIPVLGLYGEEDHGIPVEQVRAFETSLVANGVPHEIHIYPSAGHAFFNDERADHYHPDAAADAWERTLAWFGAHLTK